MLTATLLGNCRLVFRRLESNEAQTPDEVAQVIVNLIINRLHSRTFSGKQVFHGYVFFFLPFLVDIPFNIGTSAESQVIMIFSFLSQWRNPMSQRVIEMVRKNPTGWGGVYTSILQSLPQPPQTAKPKTSASAAEGNIDTDHQDL